MANTLKFGNGEWYGKKDTILAYNDLNSNYKPLPFNFSRASKATFVNKDGLIEEVGSGQPRVDYKDDSKGALLLEPQRTNYVLYSETEGIIRGSNGWSGDSDNTITQNYGTTPFTGSELKSTRIQFTSSSREFRNNTSSVTIIPTASIWIKGSVGKTIKFGSNSNEGVFTLNGEWQKLIQTGSSLSTNRLTINTYSSTTARDIEIFAPQLEQGSYATSYIPTSGSAVTRLADSCTNGGNDQVINSTEGVFYFEGSALDDDGTDRKITLSDGSLNNAINFGFSRFSGNINAEVKSGGVLQTSGFGATGIAQDNNNKFALSWGGGVSKFYVNGTLASSYTSVTSPIGMNVLNFSLSSGFQKSYLNCKDIRVYNTALSDSELAALTQV
jgi:hypothetical protein